MTQPTLDRRAFLKLAGAAATVPALHGCGPTDPPARAPEPTAAWSGSGTVDTSAFPLGVQSGDPDPAGVILWTRYDGVADLSVTWATWDGETWTPGEPLAATPSDGGFVHVPLTDLPPDTWVAYQFVDGDGAASSIGRFVAPLHPDSTAAVRFACTSCCAQNHEAFPAMTEAAADPLDFALFLGDTAYFDGLSSIEEFRGLWARNLTAPGFTDLLPSTACVYTWDDHEFENNFDPATISPVKFDIASGAFFEHTPCRRNPERPRRLWRKLQFGQTAELFVLDCRTERDIEANTYLSKAQMAWLIEGLTTSTATWKLVANSVPIANLPAGVWDVPVTLDDRWEGFPAQRAELLGALEGAGATGIMFLSGDIHCPALARLEPEGAGYRWWDIICGPAGSFLNIIASTLISGDQIPWADVIWNVASIELTHAGRARVRWIGEEGQVWCEAELDADGTLHALTFTDSQSGETTAI